MFAVLSLCVREARLGAATASRIGARPRRSAIESFLRCSVVYLAVNTRYFNRLIPVLSIIGAIIFALST